MFVKKTATDPLRLFFLSVVWFPRSDNAPVCRVFKIVVQGEHVK